jgi:hypothetical protein
MNTPCPSHDVPLSRSQDAGADPLDEITGIVWGSLIGGAFWMAALAAIFFG